MKAETIDALLEYIGEKISLSLAENEEDEEGYRGNASRSQHKRVEQLEADLRNKLLRENEG